jgi:hypothetical protein
MIQGFLQCRRIVSQPSNENDFRVRPTLSRTTQPLSQDRRRTASESGACQASCLLTRFQSSALVNEESEPAFISEDRRSTSFRSSAESTSGSSEVRMSSQSSSTIRSFSVTGNFRSSSSSMLTGSSSFHSRMIKRGGRCYFGQQGVDIKPAADQ